MNAYEHLLNWAADRGLNIWIDDVNCHDNADKAKAQIDATDDQCVVMFLQNSIPFATAWAMSGPGLEPEETVIDYSSGLDKCMEEYYHQRSLA